MVLTLQLAVFDSEVNAESVTTIVLALLLLNILCVPLFSSLTAPVTTIKSPTIALAKVEAAAVKVEPLKVKATDVLFTLCSDIRWAVVYVPELVKASGSANLKWLTVALSSKRNDCHSTACDLLMGGNDTSAVQ